jgi:hypothetical protein
MIGIITAVLGLLGPLATYFIKAFINNKVKQGNAELDEEKKRQTIEDFKVECLRAVKKIDLEYVLPLKMKGEFTADKAAEAKALAIEEAKKHLGSEKLLALALFFSENAEGMMKMIGDQIEQAIILNKKERAGSILLTNDSPTVTLK